MKIDPFGVRKFQCLAGEVPPWRLMYISINGAANRNEGMATMYERQAKDIEDMLEFGLPCHYWMRLHS